MHDSRMLQSINFFCLKSAIESLSIIISVWYFSCKHYCICSAYLVFPVMYFIYSSVSYSQSIVDIHILLPTCSISLMTHNRGYTEIASLMLVKPTLIYTSFTKVRYKPVSHSIDNHALTPQIMATTCMLTPILA